MTETVDMDSRMTSVDRRVRVVVPTANRPDLLEITLRSIARQTAVSQIHSVLVSENMGNYASKETCAIFPELPIEYVYQEPQLPVAEHVRALLERPNEAEYLALVCDDDLWSPGHLQSALDSLDRHPAASAHFSGCVHAESEFGRPAAIEGAELLWLAAGCPPRMSEYEYSQDAVLALCWVLTPFSWSTMVARSSAIVPCARTLTEAPHAAYSDRMLYPALVQHGSILFDPAIDTLYRVYQGNWQSAQDSQALEEITRDAGKQIEALAISRRVDLSRLWRKYLAHSPGPLTPDVMDSLRWRFDNQQLISIGLGATMPPTHIPTWRRYAGRVKRAWLELRGVEC